MSDGFEDDEELEEDLVEEESKGNIALKDQTFDRDLFAMNAFFQSGAIDVGVLVTRSLSLDDVFKTVGPTLTKKGAVEKDRNGEMHRWSQHRAEGMTFV
jgi:hypothetical protein